MSDPRGNHACDRAKQINEFNGRCICNVTNHEVMCGGVAEQCVLSMEGEVWITSKNKRIS